MNARTFGNSKIDGFDVSVERIDGMWTSIMQDHTYGEQVFEPITDVRTVIDGVEFVNLCPHTINIWTDDGIIDVLPSGTLARCTEERTVVNSISGIQIDKAVFGDVTGLPEYSTPHRIYIVSALVAQAVKGTRYDVFTTGKAVRNAEQQVVGCQGLSII